MHLTPFWRRLLPFNNLPSRLSIFLAGAEYSLEQVVNFARRLQMTSTPLSPAECSEFSMRSFQTRNSCSTGLVYLSCDWERKDLNDLCQNSQVINFFRGWMWSSGAPVLSVHARQCVESWQRRAHSDVTGCRGILPTVPNVLNKNTHFQIYFCLQNLQKSKQQEFFSFLNPAE